MLNPADVALVQACLLRIKSKERRTEALAALDRIKPGLSLDDAVAAMRWVRRIETLETQLGAAQRRIAELEAVSGNRDEADARRVAAKLGEARRRFRHEIEHMTGSLAQLVETIEALRAGAADTVESLEERGKNLLTDLQTELTRASVPNT